MAELTAPPDARGGVNALDDRNGELKRATSSADRAGATGGTIRNLLWVAISALLLSLVFGGYVLMMILLASSQVEPEKVRETQTAFIVYAKLIFLKGLWPQLAVTFCLFGLLQAFANLLARGWRYWTGGVVFSAMAAAALIILTLLTSDAMALPAVKLRGTGDFLSILFEMTTGLSLAIIVSRWLVSRRA